MEKEPLLGSIKHTDPHFWRYLLAVLLLCAGGMMIGDGVVKWVREESNTSIPFGCCTIFLGIIILLGKKSASVENAEQPNSKKSDDASPQLFR